MTLEQQRARNMAGPQVIFNVFKQARKENPKNNLSGLKRAQAFG